MDWVQCDGGCEEWFHYLCVGIKDADMDDSADYICYRCSHKSGTTNKTVNGTQIKTEPAEGFDNEDAIVSVVSTPVDRSPQEAVGDLKVPPSSDADGDRLKGESSGGVIEEVIHEQPELAFYNNNVVPFDYSEKSKTESDATEDDKPGDTVEANDMKVSEEPPISLVTRNESVVTELESTESVEVTHELEGSNMCKVVRQAVGESCTVLPSERIPEHHSPGESPRQRNLFEELSTSASESEMQ